MTAYTKSVACASLLLTQWCCAERFWLTSDVGYHEYRKRFVLPLSNDMFRTIYKIDRLAVDTINTATYTDVTYSDLIGVANIDGLLLGARAEQVNSFNTPQSTCIALFCLSVTQSQLVAGNAMSVPVYAPHKGVKSFKHAPSRLSELRGLMRTTSNGVEMFVWGQYTGDVPHPTKSSMFLMRGGEVGYNYPFYATAQVQTNGCVVTPLKIRQYWQNPSGQSPRSDMDQWDSRFRSLVEMSRGEMDFGILSYSVLRDSMELTSFNSSGELVNVSSVLTKPTSKDPKHALGNTYVYRRRLCGQAMSKIDR